MSFQVRGAFPRRKQSEADDEEGGIKGDIFCKKRVITYCLARVFPSTRCCSLCQEEEKKKVTDYDFECMNERVVGGERIVGKALMCFLLEKSAELVRV